MVELMMAERLSDCGVLAFGVKTGVVEDGDALDLLYLVRETEGLLTIVFSSRGSGCGSAMWWVSSGWCSYWWRCACVEILFVRPVLLICGRGGDVMKKIKHIQFSLHL